MFARLNDSVLAIDVEAVARVQGDEGLCGLWTVFTKCKESLQDGRRLENIAWRLWHREIILKQTAYDSDDETIILPSHPPLHSSSLLPLSSESESDEDVVTIVEDEATPPTSLSEPVLRTPSRPHPLQHPVVASPRSCDPHSSKPLGSTSVPNSPVLDASLPILDSHHRASPAPPRLSGSAHRKSSPARSSVNIGQIISTLLPDKVDLGASRSPRSDQSLSRTPPVFGPESASSTGTAPTPPLSHQSISPPIQDRSDDMAANPVVVTVSASSFRPTTFPSPKCTVDTNPELVLTNPTPRPTPPATPSRASNITVPCTDSMNVATSKEVPEGPNLLGVPPVSGSTGTSSTGLWRQANHRPPRLPPKLLASPFSQPVDTPSSTSSENHQITGDQSSKASARKIFFIQRSPPGEERFSSGSSDTAQSLVSATIPGSPLVPSSGRAPTPPPIVIPAGGDDPEVKPNDNDQSGERGSAVDTHPQLSTSPSPLVDTLASATSRGEGEVAQAPRPSITSEPVEPHPETLPRSRKGKEASRSLRSSTSHRSVSSGTKRIGGGSTRPSKANILGAVERKVTVIKPAFVRKTSSAGSSKEKKKAVKQAVSVDSRSPGSSAHRTFVSSPLSNDVGSVSDGGGDASMPQDRSSSPSGRRSPVPGQSHTVLAITGDPSASSSRVTAIVQPQQQPPQRPESLSNRDKGITSVKRRSVLDIATSSDFETTSDEEGSSLWSSADEDDDVEFHEPVGRGDEEVETGHLAREAALEAARQRDMFRKVPSRSYSNLGQRRQSGLLSTLMHPDPSILPFLPTNSQGSQPYDAVWSRQHNSAQNLGRRPPPLAPLGALQPMTSATATPLVSHGAPLKPTKSAAEVRVAAVSVTSKVAVNPSGRPGFRLQGRPEGQDLETDDDDTDANPAEVDGMSKSVAQRKLEQLTAPGRLRKQQEGQRTSNDSQHPSGPSHPDLRPPEYYTRQHSHEFYAAYLPENLTRTPSLPVPLPHPYNLPAPAAPQTPRTTRRQMMANEMSESLRRNLLWERQLSRRMLGGFTKIHSSKNADPALSRSGDGADRVREERALARNKSWANEYHAAGW